MLRNNEFRRFAILFSLVSAIVASLGFLTSLWAGILVSAATLAYGTVFFAFTKARYKSIAQLSKQIDLVLHNDERLYIDEPDEGELSILHSEITKMTLRIREQNDALKKEKAHLADSLADVAHQLRTPLTSANLILSLLENSPEAHERRSFVREAEELLLRMDWLLTSLLKISRLDAGVVVFQIQPASMDELIQTALRPLLIPLELRGIELQINAPQEMILPCDVNWLSEALQNIIKNCLESAGANGKIEIVCTDNPLYTQIDIHDSGRGFENEDIPCLFDRFYRGKSQDATGYGIGLALCKMIITRHGGAITAKNHPQGGALFAIRFPK